MPRGGLKRARAISCPLCSDEKLFQYKPGNFGALASLSVVEPSFRSLLTKPIWYQCPFCVPTSDVKIEGEAGARRDHPARLDVDIAASSAWLVARLVMAGIDPYLAFDLSKMTGGAVNSITAAQDMMIDKMNSAIMSLAQNQSREEYIPPPPQPFRAEEVIAEFTACGLADLHPLQRSVSSGILTEYITLLKKCMRWYPVGTATYLRALSALLARESVEWAEKNEPVDAVSIAKPSAMLDGFLEEELRVIQEGLFIDTARSGGLRCPAVLDITELALDNSRVQRCALAEGDQICAISD